MTPNLVFPELLERIHFHYDRPIDTPAMGAFADRDYRLLNEDLEGICETPLEMLSHSVLFELLNTRIDDRPTERYYRRALFHLLQMPRRSTYTLGILIHALTAQIDANSCYLNAGTWHGFSLFAGMATRDRWCFGSDDFKASAGPDGDRSVRRAFYQNFLELKNDRHFFFETDCETVLNLFQKVKIGFYFYNASHDYESQLRALMFAEPFFDERCIILVDDTNLEKTKEATVEFMNYSREPYKIIFERSTRNSNRFTWGNGITLLQRL